MADVSPTVWLWVGLAALPLLLSLATAFTKALVVVGALRTGLGAEAFLPWPAVLAVATVVTGIVMAPVGVATADAVQAVGGLEAVPSLSMQQWPGLTEPLFEFLGRHASADELSFYAELQSRPEADPLVVVPAFLTTELAEALAIAVVILVPFVLVDLVAAQALVLMGMGQAPNAVATVPIKLLLFLAVGGWDVVIGGLVRGYA
ncbi:MAG: hypothetical protein AAGA54_27090 [Myxococcota bacterium]